MTTFLDAIPAQPSPESRPHTRRHYEAQAELSRVVAQRDALAEALHQIRPLANTQDARISAMDDALNKIAYIADAALAQVTDAEVRGA